MKGVITKETLEEVIQKLKADHFYPVSVIEKGTKKEKLIALHVNYNPLIDDIEERIKAIVGAGYSVNKIPNEQYIEIKIKK